MCVVLGGVLPGCGDTAADDSSVIASFYPLAFAAREIAPPGTEVVDLTPSGAEPHDLDLTARDRADIDAARLVVYAGGDFQPAVEEAVDERRDRSLDVLADVERLPERAGGAVDPHVWLDPLRYADVARSVAAALGRPSAADNLVSRLETLDRELSRGLADCTRRTIVTGHAAFGYLADRYRLEQVPLVGLSPGAEPEARELEELVSMIRRSGATTVFVEPLVSPRLARTVAREAGVETAVLDPLEGLTAERQQAGADYFTVMRANLAALREALACR